MAEVDAVFDNVVAVGSDRVKVLVFLFALGVGHRFTDTPTVPTPPVASAPASFDSAAYLADCSQLARDWEQLQQLERELLGR